jgi:hypothetical protein
MTESDRPTFFTLMGGVHAFYRQDFSDFSGGVWWMAMKPFDLPAVQDAVNRHCVNPDNGQFMPKPADIVRLLQGSTQDGALVAWAKVDRAIRQVGTYATVCFDDPIIHRVITDMGGWVAIGGKTEKEWPFLAKEFENRYRGYRTQGGVDEYPRLLVGIAEAQNGQQGFRSQAPVLIGDSSKAKRVLASGSDKPMLGFERMANQDYLALAAPSRSAA